MRSSASDQHRQSGLTEEELGDQGSPSVFFSRLAVRWLVEPDPAGAQRVLLLLVCRDSAVNLSGSRSALLLSYLGVWTVVRRALQADRCGGCRACCSSRSPVLWTVQTQGFILQCDRRRSPTSAPVTERSSELYQHTAFITVS
ncbi:hypothetical protein MHYP_G00240720 [Metynnis hypsauchen]